MHAPLVANGATAMAVNAVDQRGRDRHRRRHPHRRRRRNRRCGEVAVGRVKGAAKWVKNHVVIGLHNIGIKGTF